MSTSPGILYNGLTHMEGERAFPSPQTPLYQLASTTLLLLLISLTDRSYLMAGGLNHQKSQGRGSVPAIMRNYNVYDLRLVPPEREYSSRERSSH